MLWHAHLRRRVQRMHDATRRGRPGEYVVGVPLGLEHLRAARQNLEANKYRGRKVFPPQAK
jgi:hypothetical protein